jgi:hypothetical protein
MVTHFIFQYLLYKYFHNYFSFFYKDSRNGKNTSLVLFLSLKNYENHMLICLIMFTIFLVLYRDFYFRALRSLVVLSFPQLVSFSSVFPSL